MAIPVKKNQSRHVNRYIWIPVCIYCLLSSSSPGLFLVQSWSILSHFIPIETWITWTWSWFYFFTVPSTHHPPVNFSRAESFSDMRSVPSLPSNSYVSLHIGSLYSASTNKFLTGPTFWSEFELNQGKHYIPRTSSNSGKKESFVMCLNAKIKGSDWTQIINISNAFLSLNDQSKTET